MGKTIIPFNQLVRDIKQEKWSKFRRALAKEDQERLDQLFEMARFHSAPASQQSHAIPMDVIFMGMFLEILRRVERIEERLQGLEGGKANEDLKMIIRATLPDEARMIDPE